MFREKSPEERIRDIERRFSKKYPEPEKGKRGWIIFPLMGVFAIVALVIAFNSDILRRQGPEKKDKTEVSETRYACSVSTRYDSSTVDLAIELGIKSIRIIPGFKEVKNEINLFVGEFKSFQDALIVSSRLNDKSVPNRIEKNNNSWRVVISAEIPEIRPYEEKTKITSADISQIERIVSSKFREMVKAEVIYREKPYARILFELEDRSECERLVRNLKMRGKTPEVRFFARS